MTARGQYLRASNYYRMAAFYAVPGHPEHRELFASSRASFGEAIACGLPAEAIAVPFEGHLLPGYFIRGRGGSSPAPTLIAHGGFDSTAEELYHWIGVHAADRGWNCLVFEGPGQWGPVFDQPPLLMRPDWEKPVAAVADYAETRPEIDTQRLALIGYSLGGYLAPRAAAMEPRIRACIASPLAVDIGAAFKTAWPWIVRALPGPAFDALMSAAAHLNVSARWALQHGRWAMGVSHPEEFFTRWQPYTLHGLEERLTIPLLVVFGEDDLAGMPTELITDTVKFAGRLPRCEVCAFTRADGGAPHCQMGATTAAAAAILDWLDGVSGAPAPAPPRPPLVSEAVFTLIEKHHGPQAARQARHLLAPG